MYEKPIMNVERFDANEYVAACGDHGTKYKFTCDAGGGDPGAVYLETNGRPGLQRSIIGIGNDKRISSSLNSYHACNITHEADTTDEFLNGYYVKFGSNTALDVIIWRGPNNDNIHCTTKLNQQDWETTKS